MTVLVESVFANNHINNFAYWICLCTDWTLKHNRYGPRDREEDDRDIGFEPLAFHTRTLPSTAYRNDIHTGIALFSWLQRWVLELLLVLWCTCFKFECAWSWWSVSLLDCLGFLFYRQWRQQKILTKITKSFLNKWFPKMQTWPSGLAYLI